MSEEKKQRYWSTRKREKMKESPEDESREKDRGIGVTDPEQPSVELLPQINVFPTMLDTRKTIIQNNKIIIKD